MTKDEALGLLVDHNCGGLCGCEKCKEAQAVLNGRELAAQKLEDNQL